jgi:peptide/nickel transport system permease protein
MKGEVGADAVYLEELRKRWGLDRPLHQQYLGFIGNLLRGDFGHSFEKS